MEGTQTLRHERAVEDQMTAGRFLESLDDLLDIRANNSAEHWRGYCSDHLGMPSSAVDDILSARAAHRGLTP